MSHFTQVGSKALQATCAIRSVVDLQNLLGTTLVLKVVFNLKTKPLPQIRLLRIQPKSQTSTLTMSLHCRRPRRQKCPTLLNLALSKIIYVWDVQMREWAIKDEKERKIRLAIEAALASRIRSSLKICQTHWLAAD